MQHFKHFKKGKVELIWFEESKWTNSTSCCIYKWPDWNGSILDQRFKIFNFIFWRKIFGIKIQILFWGWFWTIVNSTQDSFLQLCQFSLIIIKLWNLMKKSIFLGEKKGTLGNFTTKTNLWRNSLYFKWELMQCQDKVYLLHDCNSYL